jgi:hypothetical protein
MIKPTPHSDKHPSAIYKMISMLHGKDGGIEIIKFYPTNIAYANGAPMPGVVEKEIYKAVDGKVELVEVIVGKHVPRQIIEDHFEF